jgi:hypothetical protein
MEMHMKTLLTTVFIGLSAASLAAQAQQPRGTATDITAEIIDSTVKSTAGRAVSDQAVRMVDIGSYQVGVGVVHRSPTGPQGAIEHSRITEVYHMMEGAGVLVTGGTIVDPKPSAPDGMVVTVLNGPSTQGPSIQGGVSRRLKPGDVIIIPPNTPHYWSSLEGKIVYLVVRVDPDKVVKLK